MQNQTKPRVYLAGRIKKHDWRDMGSRGELTTGDEKVIEKNGFPEEDCGSFVRTGPFFLACDHGCYHAPSNHGVGPKGCPEGAGRPAVLRSCLGAIERSDFLYCWLENEAYGTATEIGYAHALGKPIFTAGPAAVGVSDLWFANSMATKILEVNDPWSGLRLAMEGWNRKNTHPWSPHEGPSVVYVIQAGIAGPIKIGVTKGDIERRITQLQTGCAERLRLIATFSGDTVTESRLHERFRNHRLEGEWFIAAPVLAWLTDMLS